MANTDIILPTQAADQAVPAIRTLSVDDLKHALRQGLDDFWAMPTHVAFLCAIYPIVGLLLLRASFAYDLFPVLYPLATGFALVGPVAAIGLYELSRRHGVGNGHVVVARVRRAALALVAVDRGVDRPPVGHLRRVDCDRPRALRLGIRIRAADVADPIRPQNARNTSRSQPYLHRQRHRFSVRISRRVTQRDFVSVAARSRCRDLARRSTRRCASSPTTRWLWRCGS